MRSAPLNKYMRQLKEYEYRSYLHDRYATQLRTLMGKPNYDINYAGYLRKNIRLTKN